MMCEFSRVLRTYKKIQKSKQKRNLKVNPLKITE